MVEAGSATAILEAVQEVALAGMWAQVPAESLEESMEQEGAAGVEEWEGHQVHWD